MTVQFILGPAGSGKSTYVMQTVTNALKQNRHKKIILLVPEQATFCYQYDLLTNYGISGILSLEVLSFQRLARTVLERTGGLARTHLDDLGKLLVLRRVLQEQETTFPYLGQSIRRPGYLMKLSDTVQELKRYQIDSDGLYRTILQQSLPESLFGNKLNELSELYRGYDAFLAQEYVDSEDVLNLLYQALDDIVLSDTEIWIDEFYDFTPQETAILGKLMQCAEAVHIVLPLDITADNPGRKAVFHSVSALYQQLLQLAETHAPGAVEQKVFSAPILHKNAEALYFLEQQYFAIGKQQHCDAGDVIHLTQAQNRASEVDYTARTIRSLCRENGYRYSDIAIFTRGEEYQLLFETILHDYDIPYFIDRKEPVQQHPLTELILSLFEIVQSNWSYQSMFRFLKCGLLPFSKNEIDLLENYVLAYGIKGSTWYRTAPWQYGFALDGSDEQENILAKEQQMALDTLRNQIVAPLLAFTEIAGEEHTAKEWIFAIYQLLDAYEISMQLEQLCQDAVTQNLLEKAQVHQQIWDKLLHIFDQMTQLLQEQPLALEDFSAIVEAAVQNMNLGLLPSSLDQVFVGALAHSRARNVKVVFVLGLNEGVFPAKASQDGFFNDYEKQLLQQMGIRLSPDGTEQLYDEQFLIYLALTRASDALYCTYALSDSEGKALRPSPIVERLHRLFPSLTETVAQWPPEEDAEDLLLYFNHKQKALGLLGSHMRAAQDSVSQPVWNALYQWFINHGDTAFLQMNNSLNASDTLSVCKLETTELFGNPIRLSVSALEKYRQCPYGYFLRYGLRLKERKQYTIQAVDTGEFYHTAIEAFSNYLLEHSISWDTLTQESVKEIVAQIVNQLAPKMQNEILMSSGRYQYIQCRMQKTVERTAQMLVEHGKRGDFIPVALEAGFGTKDGTIPGWKITLQDGTVMILQGRIDRIEQAKMGNTTYLRVIDFKSGKQGLDFSEIYYGLKIQLLTYLQVALTYYNQSLSEGETLLPAGVLYYFFHSGIVSTDGPMSYAEAQSLHLNKLRADGLLLADFHALKLSDRLLDIGSSALLPLTLLTKAEPYIEAPESYAALRDDEDPMDVFGKRNRTVVSSEQLQLLLAHTANLIAAMGEEIHSGNIAVRPCRIRNFDGCQYCEYQAICQIQTVDFLKQSEELPVVKTEELWQRLRKEASRDTTAEKGGESHA